MRDIHRIDPFMNELTEVWKEVPDWRFGQLIENLKRHMNIKDLFYVEDDKRLEVLKNLGRN